jgi:hypothetical protein
VLAGHWYPISKTALIDKKTAVRQLSGVATPWRLRESDVARHGDFKNDHFGIFLINNRDSNNKKNMAQCIETLRPALVCLNRQDRGHRGVSSAYPGDIKPPGKYLAPNLIFKLPVPHEATISVFWHRRSAFE